MQLTVVSASPVPRGGALSAVLVHLIDSGTVDAVVQTKASAELPIGNAPVISMDTKSITAAAGSRYAPSAPLEGINAQIAANRANGTRYAFVGKPCDVAATRTFGPLDSTALHWQTNPELQRSASSCRVPAKHHQVQPEEFLRNSSQDTVGKKTLTFKGHP